MKNKWYSLVSVSCEKSFSSYVHIKHNIWVLCLGHARIKRCHPRSTTSCVNIGYACFIANLVWNIMYYFLYMGTVSVQGNKKFRKHPYGGCIWIETCIFKFILSGQNKLPGVWKWNKTLRRTLEKLIEGLPKDYRNISYILSLMTCSQLSP